ncbi:MAG: UDP-N-acetylmuramate dehydrogenase [Alistipes sp.]|nr:UDP-N-acetylmuramate dehydrogenase [Alistipes sp.]
MIRIFENTDISNRNSFHVRQKAALLVEFDRAEELSELFDRHISGEWMALGGGNNILFTRDVERALIVPCDTRIEVESENDEEVLVRAGAGVEWDDLVEWSVQHQLWGIVNLSLIPGKVGAAPVQNIGAYGAEAKDSIVSVDIFTPQSRTHSTIEASECRFGYRDSIFKGPLKGQVIITSVLFRLSKQAAPMLGYGDVAQEVEARGGVSLHNIREAICAIRRRKLPDTAVTGNAGSFFKNPVVERSVAEALLAEYPDMPHYPAADPTKVKLAAGWLIDRAGLKGHKQGCVGVHEKQALVLINLGGATGGEVVAFARSVQAAVAEKFGIEIEAEVNIL